MGLLLLDFDGTITQSDTLHSLISLAIVSSQKGKGKGKEEELTALWSEIVQEYVAAHARHRAAYHPPADQRRSLAAELAFLESVAVVERASVARVGRAGFFGGAAATAAASSGDDGLGLGFLRGLGREAVRLGLSSSSSSSSGDPPEGAVRVRRGFGEFVGRMGGVDNNKGGGWDVAVVSVNWSGEFIRGVVEAGCGGGRIEAGESVRRVVANAVGVSDGLVEGPRELGGEPLVTAGDKLRAMKWLKEGMEEERVVYFGDSTTDLACLVEADFGVVMADDADSKLLKTLKRVGFEVPHVGDGEVKGKLVWARDFDEVLKSGVMDGI
ncbi:hypothetical protein C8A00DRAFT_14239 [Chaetomidium leptoderma]|uniref:Uncharacterized protein n=1 Tax=Chaetomidium leptoderma TaxID=669021 RepID=A0AAN6VNL8_9PEZI|nr:hypothetical protein C8A00DRAFT_14239 [Chaetomidium leptoderma]